MDSKVEEITEQDCIEYMIQLVIDRTFDGYMTEIKTIYGQLEKELQVKIEPAPESLFFQGILIAAGIIISLLIGILVVALMQASRTNWLGERIVRNQKRTCLNHNKTLFPFPSKV